MQIHRLGLAVAMAAAATAGAAGATLPPGAHPGSFADNPIVYFVITDRFLDGNPANNHAYGRSREADPLADVATFHGGDLAGLTRRVKEGWFDALGVNALWITAPYEQIHGWVVGGRKEFKSYAYHGYYALDYTRLDANMGTPEELHDLVDAAHARGIRVLFDIVMNHPGYADIRTLSEYLGRPVTDKKSGVLWKGYEAATTKDYQSWIDYNDPAWRDWWGPDWVRAGLRGYTEGGSDDLTRQLDFLPDFKTEQARPVGLPPLLARKPDTLARELPDTPVRGYLVAWLTQWVRDFGIDGFRCDTAKHVEAASWMALKQAGLAALKDWKAAHASTRVDDAPFWMTGEVWGHGVERDAYFDAGFDNLINFDFQALAAQAPAPLGLDAVYARYAAALQAPATFNVLSYISSHDTALFDRARLDFGAEALMLAPGGVQIFYGDETARPPGPLPAGDPHQATRSDMNWGSIDASLLEHWRRLGTFRAHHVALARGRHVKIAESPYVFSRADGDDHVVVVLGASGTVRVPVDGVFPEGNRVHDAYGGATSVVRGGTVEFAAGARGVLLLESAP